VIRVVRLRCVVGQDEDSVWCASALLRPGAGAVGDGPTRQAAIADLRTALDLLIDEVSWPGDLACKGPRPYEGD
jgi:hypothetical protein